MSIGVKVLDVEEDYLGRNVSLNVNNKTISGFQISKRSNRSKYERQLFSESNQKSICEYSVTINHDKLDRIASNNESYRSFISNNLSRIEANKDINMIIFQIEENKGYLTKEDIETLADLLLIRGNDIIVPPFIRTDKGSFDTDRYINLIKILKDSLGNCNIACPIPEQASKKDIVRIIDTVESPNQIFVKDCNGKKVFDSVGEMQIRTMLRKINDIEKNYNEGSFIYAFDSRPNPKNGNNKNFVEGQIASALRLNAVGPKRKRELIPKDVSNKMKESNPFDSQKLFNANDYRFYSISSGTITEKYSDFILSEYGCDYQNLKINDLRNSVFTFNYKERVSDTNNINDAIAHSELRDLILEKNTPQSTIKYLEKVSKNVNSSD